MSVFKRGKTYWFHFIWNREHIQKSAKQGNPRVAREIEAAFRTKLLRERSASGQGSDLRLTESLRGPGRGFLYLVPGADQKYSFIGKQLEVQKKARPAGN